MMTELDRLCAVPFHEAADADRARIMSRLADTMLFVMLASDPSEDRADLALFDVGGGTIAVASDDDATLAGFAGKPVAHLAMPGRVLAGRLAEQGRGLLVNPGRVSQMMLDTEALAWLIASLAIQPDTADVAGARLSAPRPDAVAALAETVAARLGDMTGLVGSAALVAADWRDGRSGHLLILLDVAQPAQDATARAMAQLIAFAPFVAGGVDVTFQDLPLPLGALRIVAEAAPAPSTAPRRKPDGPPRLR